MQTVRDDHGKRYLLCKRSETASLVRDPTTGNECYVQNDRLEPVDDAPPLETAANGIDSSVRTLFRAVHDDQALGFLIELVDRGPLAVTTLLESYDYCESDLHGTIAELTVAGLLEETEVHGHRGYRATTTCEHALSRLRGDDET